MSFTHVQGTGAFPGTVTTATVTMGAAPGLHHIVCFALNLATTTVTGVTVADTNGNTYTLTPHSPESNGLGGNTYLAYLLSAPSNAAAGITASWTTASSCSIWADEFSWIGLQPTFDTDIGAGGTGGTVNTPSITPTYPNSLLYSACGSSGTITAPTAGGTLGVWTGSAAGVLDGDMAEYDLSASAATAVNYTQGATDIWSAMAMSFSQLQPGGGAYRIPVFWMG